MLIAVKRVAPVCDYVGSVWILPSFSKKNRCRVKEGLPLFDRDEGSPRSTVDRAYTQFSFKMKSMRIHVITSLYLGSPAVYCQYGIFGVFQCLG